MTNHDSNRPIIIRRIKKIKKGGHHGGSWKIAYADFVTAMMAFFLLMWMLGLLNKYQLQGVAEYFQKPLKEAFEHESNMKGVDKNRDKNTEREKGKEKPNKVAEEETKLGDRKDAHNGPQEAKPNQKQANLGDRKEQYNGPMQLKSIANNNTLSGPIESKQEKSMETIRDELVKKMATHPELKEFKNQLNFIVTADGLRIQLKDLENKPMFTKGKADFENYSKKIIKWLGEELNTYPNNVVIIGHTDAAPFAGDRYSNWELSADRANSTRRQLIKQGLDEKKILRVIGVSANAPLNKQNAIDPVNRRIEILILTKDAKEKLIND